MNAQAGVQAGTPAICRHVMQNGNASDRMPAGRQRFEIYAVLGG
jgi:hypothetical protein